MSLTDQPTPETSKLKAKGIEWVPIGRMEHQEQLARAWREVAEKLATEMRDLAWLAGPAGSTQPNDAEIAISAFDTLKKQADEH